MEVVYPRSKQLCLYILASYIPNKIGKRNKNKGTRELRYLTTGSILSHSSTPFTCSNIEDRNILVSELGMADQRIERLAFELGSLKSEVGSLKVEQQKSFKEMMDSLQNYFAAVNTRFDQGGGNRDRGESSSNRRGRPKGRQNESNTTGNFLVHICQK